MSVPNICGSVIRVVAGRMASFLEQWRRFRNGVHKIFQHGASTGTPIRCNTRSIEDIWAEDLRNQAHSSGIQLTTEGYDRGSEMFVQWAVNMDRCPTDWSFVRQSDVPPRIYLRWNARYKRWECHRLRYPQPGTEELQTFKSLD